MRPSFLLLGVPSLAAILLFACGGEITKSPTSQDDSSKETANGSKGAPSDTKAVNDCSRRRCAYGFPTSSEAECTAKAPGSRCYDDGTACWCPARPEEPACDEQISCPDGLSPVASEEECVEDGRQNCFPVDSTCRGTTVWCGRASNDAGADADPDASN